MDLKEKFGKKVKELRKAYGKRNISITVAEKIASALNMKISELFKAVESDVLPNKTSLK